MKTIIPIVVLFLAVVSINYGQESRLVLTNSKNSKRSNIEAGNYIKVYISKESYLAGQLNLIDTGTIAVGSDTILLSDISVIVAKTSGTKTGGLITLSTGILALVGGIATLAAANEDGTDDFVPAVRGVGVALVIVGSTTALIGAGNLAVGKNYKKERWEYSVQKGTYAKP